MLNHPIRRLLGGNFHASNQSLRGEQASAWLATPKTLLLAGMFALMANSARAQLPQPVQLPLQSGETIVSSETYVDGAPHQEVGLADYWDGVPGFNPPAQVPHVIIQAPAAPKNARNHGSVPANGYAPNRSSGHSQHGHQQSAGSVHPHLQHAHQKAKATMAPLTHPPGVENDPGAKGPGRLGVGEHWVKNPQTRPTIPAATVQPRWKTPYSYGYFGAEGKRHWSRQHGYQDRSLQWSLR
ncbi:hypothetical protein [Rhodopirellula europaea]|uniref:Putative secreted protein n=1 Tax=Rhodopirellula europaea 6C TaxID=1263867 RepID=M2ATX3_9BACT|nr:hypothetical protein [Rhodopirellula europaea]EMB16167.1 putative secreted protein [Rhodopirellula europaea 6C]|tara:strand:+ start:43402 stop:44121 length:720 start_codon:yes stop_codon:yes gene_type:complete